MTQERCRRIGEWLGWLAVPGMVVFIASEVYSVYTFRTSPKSPDASHCIAWVEHGDCVYLTPMHDQLCSRVPIAGFAEAFAVSTAAAVLYNRCRFNVTIRFKKDRK